jgi:hypothetical protein
MIRVHGHPLTMYVALPDGGWRGSPAAVREHSPGRAAKPRLLDRVRGALRTRHYSRRTEEIYVAWFRRYIHRSPADRMFLS